MLAAARVGLSSIKEESATSDEQMGVLAQVRTLLSDCRGLNQTANVVAVTVQLEGVVTEVMDVLVGSR